MIADVSYRMLDIQRDPDPGPGVRAGVAARQGKSGSGC